MAYPIYNPDGSFGAAPETVVTGNGAGNNIVGRLMKGGYRRDFENDMQVNLRASQKLNFIANGLKLSALVSYSSNQGFSRDLGRTNFLSFIYNSKTQTYTPLLPNTYRDEKYTLGSTATTVEKRLNTQLSLNYDTTFNRDHHVYALVLLNQFSETEGAALPENFRGIRSAWDMTIRKNTSSSSTARITEPTASRPATVTASSRRFPADGTSRKSRSSNRTYPLWTC